MERCSSRVRCAGLDFDACSVKSKVTLRLTTKETSNGCRRLEIKHQHCSERACVCQNAFHVRWQCFVFNTNLMKFCVNGAQHPQWRKSSLFFVHLIERVQLLEHYRAHQCCFCVTDQSKSRMGRVLQHPYFSCTVCLMHPDSLGHHM